MIVKMKEKIYNFNNLSDFEFEVLCKDIMQKKLGIKLYTF